MSKCNKKKLGILMIGLLGVFSFATINNHSEMLGSTMNSYYEGVDLDGVQEDSLAEALGLATDGSTVSVDGDVTADGDLIVKSGVTLSINGYLTVPNEYDFVVEDGGIVYVNSEATLFLDGSTVLEYISMVDVNGLLSLGEHGDISTRASSEHPTGNALINVYKTGEFNGFASQLVATSNLRVTSFGGVVSDDIKGALGGNYESLTIYDEENRIYYHSFADVPASTEIKIIGNTIITNDTIPTSVVVSAVDGIVLKVDGTLTINGALKMNESELIANQIAGTGILEVTPGYYEADYNDYMIYTTINGIASTVSVSSNEDNATINDILFKINKDNYSDAKAVGDSVVVSSKLSNYEPYVATRACSVSDTECEEQYVLKLSHKAVPDGAFYELILNEYYKIKQEEAGSSIIIDMGYLMSNDDFALITELNAEYGFEYLLGEKDYTPIRDITGINKLVNLESIELSDQYLLNPDFSGAGNLTSIRLSNASYDNTINSINVSGLTNLETVDVRDVGLKTINLTGATNLTSLNLRVNEIEEIDLSSLTNLEELDIAGNKLTSLETSGNQKLVSLDATSNKLNNVDFILNPLLETLILNDNKLITLDLSNNRNLKILGLYKNDLIYLDITNSDKLERINTQNTNLEEINLNNKTLLKSLSFDCKEISSVDFSQLTLLESLSNSDDYYQDNCVNISRLDLQNNTNLKEIALYGVGIGSVNLNGLTNLEMLVLKGSNLEEIDLSTNTALTLLDLTNNNLSAIDLTNNSLLESLSIENNVLEEIKIDSESNPNLISLHLNNNELISLSLDGFENLIGISAGNNLIEEVSINNLPILTDLNLGKNYIVEDKLTLTNLSSLRRLDLQSNNLESLDLTNLTSLKDLFIIDNPFKGEIRSYVGDTFAQADLINPVKLNGDMEVVGQVWELGMNQYGDYTVQYGGEHNLSITYNPKSYSNARFTVNYTVLAPTFSSDKYEFNEDDGYVYISNNTLKDLEDNVTVVAGVGKANDDGTKFEIKYSEEDETALYSYDIIRFQLENLETSNKAIIYEGEITFQDVIDDIVDDRLEVKLYKYETQEGEPGDGTDTGGTTPPASEEPEGGEPVTLEETEPGEDPETGDDPAVTPETPTNPGGEPVTPGGGTTQTVRVEVTDPTTVIVKGMELEVYYDSVKVDMFTLTDDYIETGDLTITESNLIVDLELGSTYEDVMSQIDTSGIVTWYDKNNQVIEDTTNLKLKTGQKVVIELSAQRIELVISIKGDVTGTGESTISDIMRIIDHALTDAKLTDECYLYAADYNSDESISISDVMMLVDDLL